MATEGTETRAADLSAVARSAKVDSTGGSETTPLAVVTLLYAVLTFLMALPFSASPGSRVLADAPDMHLFIWTLAWDADAFLSQPLNIFDANIYYPFANTLAYSENLIGSAFFAAPIIWLTGNLVLATNLTALTSCVLCGSGAYLLARRVHITVAGAFVCGLIFAFAPPRFFRISQLHLTAVQWIPFTLAFLHTYLDSGKRSQLLLAIACFSLQALSSGHGAVYVLLTVLGLLVWHLAFGGALDPRKRLADVGAAGLYLLAPAVWVILPYRIAQDEAGLRRGYLADALPGIENFLASPARFHLYLKEMFLEPFPEEASAFLFPGFLVVIVAAIAVVTTLRRPWRTNAAAFYLLVGVVSTLMFVDRPIELWRYVYWLPGFNFTRVPSRFMILTMLALSVLAGRGVDRLLTRCTSRARTIGLVVISLLFLAEYNAYPMVSEPFGVEIPAVDRWLDTRPKPFVVAEMPVPSEGNRGALERQQTRAMLHATAHWQKTIHGYSGIRQPFHDQLYRDLNGFPNPRSLERLHEVGVTYVVVHTGDYGAGWPAIEEAIAKSGRLTLEHADGTGRVYSILAR